MLISVFSVIFAAICLAQMGSMLWGARRDNRKSVYLFALGLGCHAGGYLFLFAAGAPVDWLVLAEANTAVSAAWALYFAAIATLQGRLGRWRLATLLPVAQITVPLLAFDQLWQVLFWGWSVLLAQNLLLLLLLYRRPFPFAGGGRGVLGSACILSALSLLGRMVRRGIYPVSLIPIDPMSEYALGVYLLGLVSMILACNGFTLMTRERSTSLLHDAALRDHLTGCWRRERIEKCAAQELERLQRDGNPVSALMIDLDHFKEVNDASGHAAGDAVLSGFGQLLQDTIRATDIAGRWGGEEFVIIMPGCGLAEAIPLSERLRLRLEQTVFADGLSVTASIGIALARSTDTWKDWLARADSGLYAAKAAGRNQVVVEDLEVEFIPREMEPSTYRLKWRKSYEIGVPEIDAEHREIFESVNELLALRPPHRSREEIFGKVLSLAGAVQAHFAHEEKILQSVSHGDAVHAHIATHRVLTQRAGDLIRKYQKGTIDSSALLSFVSFDYIIQHILIEDRSLASLLARAQPGSKEGPSFF